MGIRASGVDPEGVGDALPTPDGSVGRPADPGRRRLEFSEAVGERRGAALQISGREGHEIVTRVGILEDQGLGAVVLDDEAESLRRRGSEHDFGGGELVDGDVRGEVPEGQVAPGLVEAQFVTILDDADLRREVVAGAGYRLRRRDHAGGARGEDLTGSHALELDGRSRAAAGTEALDAVGIVAPDTAIGGTVARARHGDVALLADGLLGPRATVRRGEQQRALAGAQREEETFGGADRRSVDSVVMTRRLGASAVAREDVDALIVQTVRPRAGRRLTGRQAQLVEGNLDALGVGLVAQTDDESVVGVAPVQDRVRVRSPAGRHEQRLEVEVGMGLDDGHHPVAGSQHRRHP